MSAAVIGRSGALLPPGFVVPRTRKGETIQAYVKRSLQAWREFSAKQEYDRQKRWQANGEEFGTGPLKPTPQRAQHDPVELLETPIADEEGNVAQPHRTVDPIERMYRRRRLTAEEYGAAMDFRGDFAAGQLQALRAVELGRIRGGGKEPQFGEGVYDARERVGRACEALGARGGDPGTSAAASAVWHVVGGEMTVKAWVLRMRWGARRTMTQEHGAAVLIAALGVLVAHYERVGGRRR